ncbi:MAG: cupin domain-containing protein [Chloroflexi bacterium]|nr:cupin domain-containing protein [Chloroflexota bacterium]
MAVVVPSYKKSIAFTPSRFNPVAMAQSDRVRVLLVCLEPGQFIPVHRPGIDMTLLVLEGKAKIVADKQEAEIEAGAVVFVPAGEKRGLHAETRVVALHVVSPLPGETDHNEVMAGLARGTWR